MDRRQLLLFKATAVLAVSASAADPVTEIVFDSNSPGELIRALNGVNGGPLAAGGLLDLSARWKEAIFPLARLHDSHWPNPDVVDIHAVFPNLSADPTRPESYDFERTDEYVKAVHDCGADIVYRLGESIEHQEAKRRAHPPKDFEKWAAVCAGIVRHYTTGWANGFQFPIRYWEIWNEPDNRPNCWTGSDGDYLRLYTTTASTLRKEFPKIKIGGPGLGNSGDLKGDLLEPTLFLKAFLARCKKENVPLDFLSWHSYTSDPSELLRRAKGIRAILNQSGFRATESHLNEWNYLPDGSWSGIKAKDSRAREKWYSRVNGSEGAAFTAASLINFQDSPLDAANYFTAESPGMGLFSQHGVPSRAFGAFLAFKELVGLKRLTGKSPAGVTLLAGMEDQVRILVASAKGGPTTLKVSVSPAPWKGATDYEILSMDEQRDLSKMSSGRVDRCSVSLDLTAYSVCLIRLRQAPS